jgi:hypothetical protein
LLIYQTSFHGVYKPIYNVWGAPPCGIINWDYSGLFWIINWDYSGKRVINYVIPEN